MGNWLADVVRGAPDSERELVDRYTERLLAVARRRLPARLRQRVDPEDIVQSVYRSFFRRLKRRQLQFEESQDLWRLLAAITYYKVYNSVKFHQRERRDVRRESALPACDSIAEPAPESDAGDLNVLYDCLERLLAILPESAKMIVVKRLEGMPIDAIAVEVQRSRRTVLRVLANVQEQAAHILETLE